MDIETEEDVIESRIYISHRWNGWEWIPGQLSTDKNEVFNHVTE